MQPDERGCIAVGIDKSGSLNNADVVLASAAQICEWLLKREEKGTGIK